MPANRNPDVTTPRDPDLDVTRALEQVGVPAYVVDRTGRIRWLNRGAIELVGSRVGQPFTHLVAPEDLHLARAHFAKKLIGEARSTEYNVTLLGRDGRRLVVRVSSVPLCEGGEIVGVFGLAYPVMTTPGGGTLAKATEAPELTARQYETLALLADGLATGEIAARLGVAEETARNHIRRLLRQLDAHSRLEAVTRAYRLGLLRPPS
jgi:PAS domain S-box-containing protein